MMIDFRKVEFTGEQIDDCFDGVISSITTGAFALAAWKMELNPSSIPLLIL
jgi:hypothetical protein